VKLEENMWQKIALNLDYNPCMNYISQREPAFFARSCLTATQSPSP
jgi:hypothetical protein